MNSFMDYVWLTVWWFLLLSFLMLLVRIFGDLFRDHELSGWGKALWSIFLIFIPFLGALVYLIARGNGMAERSIHEAQGYQAAQADYIRSVAGSTTGPSPTEQIAQAQALLNSGAITADEFARLKSKALA